jgi:hypothetical protein
MPEKKASSAKGATTTKTRAAKGDQFSCDVCGLVLTVDEACGCAETMLLCCNEPMKPKRKAAKKA